MTQLLLVRHSEPVLSRLKPPSQWELTERGRERSLLLGEYLKQRGTDQIIASSELKAIETAEIAASVVGLEEVEQVHDLREHERKNSKIISADERRALVIESLRRSNELIFGSETVETARSRFADAITRLLQETSASTVAVVTHGTVMSAFVAHLLNADPGPIWNSLGLPGTLEIEWPDPTEIVSQLKFE